MMNVDRPSVACRLTSVQQLSYQDECGTFAMMYPGDLKNL